MIEHSGSVEKGAMLNYKGADYEPKEFANDSEVFKIDQKFYRNMIDKAWNTSF